MKGYIQIYTGNGKGKTTAALGLALRAAGAGKKIFIAQFVKGKTYNEMVAIRKFLPQITIKKFGLGCCLIRESSTKDTEAARKGLKKVKDSIASGKYDLVILDEIFIAIHLRLLSNQEVIETLKKKKNHVEVVLTGRYAPSEIIEMADLVTEMLEVKHYYYQGVKARKGIEY